MTITFRGVSTGESTTTLPVDNCRIGFFDYDDGVTSTAPIQLIDGLDPVQITNSATGAQTKREFAPVGVTDIWNGTTSEFDFTQLRNGDMIDIRTTLFITPTSPNQRFSFYLRAGIGGFEYTVPFIDIQLKQAVRTQVSRFNGIYIGDDNTRLNSAIFEMTSDGDADIEVGGWYCKLLMRG